MNLNELPDVNFVSLSVEELINEKIKKYEDAYFEQYNQKKQLYPGDPIRIFLYAQALREYQLLQLIDYSAKQNLLKYAEGDFLEHKAGDRNVKRLSASKATAPILFTFSAPLTSVQVIPSGTRVTPGGNIFFSTIQSTEVQQGDTEIEIVVECNESGTVGNDYLPGQINTLVDPIPFVSSITNTERSQGGANTEDDDSLRERAFLAPEAFSVAGPSGAYEFFAKNYSPAIIDVKVLSPNPGEVDVIVLLEDGQIPESTFLDGLLEYLSDKERRPLTDNVSTNAPDVVNYNLDVTYYVSSDKSGILETIQSRIESAINDYLNWQKNKIGRDINPSKLIRNIIDAGGKRVIINSPDFINIEDNEVAVEDDINIQFGGIEDE